MQNANFLNVLNLLKQPYTIEGNKLIITPTSSALLELLPGEWVDTDDSAELHCNLDEQILTDKYISRIIKMLAKHI